MMSSPQQSWLRSSVLLLSLAAGCTQSAPTAPPPAPRYEFFIFVCTDPAMRAAVELPLGSMIAELAVPTEKVHLIVCHPTRHEPLGAITVPAVDGEERLDDPSIADVTDRWNEFLTGESEGDSSLQLNLPAVSTTIAELRQTSLPPRIILCGDQLYDDPRHPGWSMKGGVRISDGALRPNTSGPRSPFVEGVVPFPPESLLVHLAPQVDGCLDDLHRAKTLRFNRAFVQMNGALWVRSTKDPVTAFRFAEPFNTEQVVLCDEPAGLVRESFITKDNGDERGPEEQVLERLSPPPKVTPATPNQPRKQTFVKPIVRESVVSTESLLKPRAQLRRDQLVPVRALMPQLQGPQQHVAILIDCSGSYANENGEPTAAWTAQMSAVRAQLQRFGGKKFVVMGFGGKGPNGEYERLESYPWYLFSPAWALATIEQRTAACEAIASWECAGCTPTFPALREVFELPGLDTIILYSDGAPNVGGDQAEILEFIADRSVTINTISIQPITDREPEEVEIAGPEFMRRLADETGGAYSILPVSD